VPTSADLDLDNFDRDVEVEGAAHRALDESPALLMKVLR
jgi:hypothetical protein